MKQLTLSSELRWISAAYADRIKASDTPLPIETVYFGLDFIVPEIPASAEILVSAHSRYALYINGEFAAFGPCKSDEWHRYADRINLAPHLKPGANRIVFKVTAYPPRESESGIHAGPQWSYNRACGAVLLLEGNIGKACLSTGIADWRVLVSNEMTPVRDTAAHLLGYKECVYGNNVPNIAGDLAEWKTCEEKLYVNTDKYGITPVFPLYERPIPMLFLERKFFANISCVQTVPANSTVTIILDAGEITTGFPRFNISKGGGASVKITYAESYTFAENNTHAKRRRDDSRGVIYGHFDIYHPSGGDDVYQPFHFRTFRYIELGIQTADTPLIFNAFDYLETGYPLEPHTILHTADEWVENIWALSLRTLRRCMHETYEDCPYYEQLQYTMDTRLQILFTYALCEDTRLARKAIYEYHSSRLPNGILQASYPTSAPQIIPVFSLHWIFMLCDYYEQTADKEFLRQYLGTVDQILHYFRIHKRNGLAEFLGYWETMDWAEAWSDNTGVPHACNYGASTIQNFQYSYALQEAAKLYELFGLNDMASAYRLEAKEINQTLMERCYNGELFREGPELEEYSQHSQLWGALAGVGNKEFRKILLLRALDDKSLIPVSFPTVFYLMRALESEGLYELTLPLWDRWKLLIDLGLTTVPETSFGRPRSDCHAWGSILLYELPRKFLGVSPAEPGWKSIVVEPKGFFISNISGTVSLPQGKITVQRIVCDDMLSVSITPECNQPVYLAMPDGTKLQLKNKECFNTLIKLSSMQSAQSALEE